MLQRLIIAALILSPIALSACNNCEALANSICEDLGAEDCAIWRENNGPDSLAGGRRPERQCFNVRFTPGRYSPYLTGAKNLVSAVSQAKQRVHR